MPLEGLRAWIGEVERKLGMRTRVFLVLAALAIGGAGAAIYLTLDTREAAVSESDVQTLQQELEAQIAGGGTATGTDLTQLEADLRSLEAEVEELRGAAAGAAGGDGGTSAGESGPGAAGTGSGGSAGAAKANPANEDTDAGNGVAANAGGSGTNAPKLRNLAEDAADGDAAANGQAAPARKTGGDD